MQRLFSMFPAGLPGVALLLLRIAIAGLLSVSTLSNEPAGNVSVWLAISLIITCLLLMIGALTPLACLTAAVLEATYWLRTDGLTSVSLALDMLVSLSMFFLGPGAYSLDSKMFGRRLILPNSKS
jgi:uncharacterized membrane protein YphA (DoxX/SURF4 family)